MSKSKPSYYAILTADVRYNENLSSSEKLFYAEITALTQKNGKCWASNSYFSKLYDVANSTISSWVNSLEKEGLIDVEYKRKGKQIDKRIITLRGIQKSEGGIQKNGIGYSENVKENNTSNNNTSDIYAVPDKSDVVEYFKEKNDIPKNDIPLEAENFINHYEERDWKKNNGKRIKYWKKQASTWNNNYVKWNRDKNKDDRSLQQQLEGMMIT